MTIKKQIISNIDNKIPLKTTYKIDVARNSNDKILKIELFGRNLIKTKSGFAKKKTNSNANNCDRKQCFQHTVMIADGRNARM